MKKVACVALLLLLVTLPCLSLCGCKTPDNFAPAELTFTPTVEQSFDGTPKGSLNLAKAPFVLDDAQALQNKRITKIAFSCSNVQKGQTFSLFTYSDTIDDATKTTITLEDNYTTQNNVVTVDLTDVVVWVRQKVGFFDLGDTIQIDTFDGDNATSTKDLSNACLPISIYTHDYGNFGMALSVLGDSISTFDGVSNSSSYNTSLALNKTYYPRYDVTSPSKTWWSLANEMTGGSLVVNNSWSGSLVTNQLGRAWQKRCVNLHNDTTNKTPNVIAFYMGTNDLGQVEVGQFEKLDDVYNKDTGYVTPQTFAQAYAICLHKMKLAYPNAKIFAFTLPESSYSVDRAVLDEYNQTIKLLADYFDCYLVDLLAMDGYHYTTHTGDNLHPTVQGMLCIADYFARCVQASMN